MRIITLGLVALVVASITSLHAAGPARQATGKGEPKEAPKPPLFHYTLAEAQEIEKKNALPITGFYDTPKLLPGPGELIRSQRYCNYRFPGDFKPVDLGITVVRFLYCSQDAFGKPVPAS